MQVPSILWVGPTTGRREFAAIVESLRSHYHFRSSDELVSVDKQLVPQLVILAQSRPGEYKAEDVGALRKAWPKTRFVSLPGSWCEGEACTGTPLPNIPRIYATRWPAGMTPSQLTMVGVALDGDESSTSGLPRFANTTKTLVAVYSAHDGYRQALVEMLAGVGCGIVSASVDAMLQVTGVDFIIWDVPCAIGQRHEEITTLRRRHPEAYLVGLMHFPRYNDLETLGIDRIIPQPFPYLDLLNVVSNAIPTMVSSAA